MIQSSYVLRLYINSQLYIYVVLTFMFILHSYSYFMFSNTLIQLCLHLYSCTYILFILKPSCFTFETTFISMLMHLMFILILILIYVFILTQFVFILILIFALIFILTFIRFMLYSYSHIYSHLYDLCLCSRLFVYAQNLYSHFPYTFMFILVIVLLLLCSHAYSYLSLYYAHAFIYTQNLYVPTCTRVKPEGFAYVGLILFGTQTCLYATFLCTSNFIFRIYVYLNSYATSTSCADHATIGIIAGAHGIVVIRRMRTIECTTVYGETRNVT
ncbi:hypothetical protein HanRHA438_Chr08g0362451 [Helianthus annuus]|nr:hypothetical protein HanRHA438_Chr08g0362451 [Helianthus annuus]